MYCKTWNLLLISKLFLFMSGNLKNGKIRICNLLKWLHDETFHGMKELWRGWPTTAKYRQISWTLKIIYTSTICWKLKINLLKLKLRRLSTRTLNHPLARLDRKRPIYHLFFCCRRRQRDMRRQERKSRKKSILHLIRFSAFHSFTCSREYLPRPTRLTKIGGAGKISLTRVKWKEKKNSAATTLRVCERVDSHTPRASQFEPSILSPWAATSTSLEEMRMKSCKVHFHRRRRLLLDIRISHVPWAKLELYSMLHDRKNQL